MAFVLELAPSQVSTIYSSTESILFPRITEVMPQQPYRQYWFGMDFPLAHLFSKTLLPSNREPGKGAIVMKGMYGVFFFFYCWEVYDRLKV